MSVCHRHRLGLSLGGAGYQRYWAGVAGNVDHGRVAQGEGKGSVDTTI